jgi:hypothetical protein
LEQILDLISKLVVRLALRTGRAIAKTPRTMPFLLEDVFDRSESFTAVMTCGHQRLRR